MAPHHKILGLPERSGYPLTGFTRLTPIPPRTRPGIIPSDPLAAVPGLRSCFLCDFPEPASVGVVSGGRRGFRLLEFVEVTTGHALELLRRGEADGRPRPLAQAGDRARDGGAPVTALRNNRTVIRDLGVRSVLSTRPRPVVHPDVQSLTAWPSGRFGGVRCGLGIP